MKNTLRKYTGKRALTGCGYKSAGFSLIEVMVGIAVSLVVLLAATVFYKSIVNLAYDKQQGSKAVAQQLTALSTVVNMIAIKIQNSGYGLEAVANTHLKLYSNAALEGTSLTGTPQTIAASAPVSGNLIIWQEAQEIGGTVRCRGFLSNEQDKSVYYLYNDSCPTLTQSGWNSRLVVKEGVLFSPLTFSAQLQGSCAPLGYVQASGVENVGLVVALAGQSLYKNGSYQHCLLNF